MSLNSLKSLRTKSSVGWVSFLTPSLTLEQAEILFKDDPESVFIYNDIGETALHIQTDPEVVELLLQNGVKPNCRTKMGNTPLHYKSNSKVVELLLNHGANPLVINHYGNTPLHKQTDPESVKLLIEAGANTKIKNLHGKLPRDVNIFAPRNNMMKYILFLFFILLVSYIGVSNLL